jgi:hypothetical protein
MRHPQSCLLLEERSRLLYRSLLNPPLRRLPRLGELYLVFLLWVRTMFLGFRPLSLLLGACQHRSSVSSLEKSRGNWDRKGGQGGTHVGTSWVRGLDLLRVWVKSLDQLTHLLD